MQLRTRGQSLALRLADEAPPGRGFVTINVAFDPLTGTPGAEYRYEQPAEF